MLDRSWRLIMSSGSLSCHGTPRFKKKNADRQLWNQLPSIGKTPRKSRGTARRHCSVVIITVSIRWRSRRNYFCFTPKTAILTTLADKIELKLMLRSLHRWLPHNHSSCPTMFWGVNFVVAIVRLSHRNNT